MSNLVGEDYFYIILVWVHLVAATFWVGGMLFLSIVAAPLLRKAPNPASAQGEFVNHARRFWMLVWIAFFFLVVTGAILLPNVVNFSESLINWSPAVLMKPTLVFLLIGVSQANDQISGPKVRTLKQKPTSEMVVVDKILLYLSLVVGCLTLLLGLAILFTAVSIVRS